MNRFGMCVLFGKVYQWWPVGGHWSDPDSGTLSLRRIYGEND